jgi:hypothetical protein
VEIDGCSCTCHVGFQGNFCKHRAKVLLMDGMTPKEIIRRYGTFYGAHENVTTSAGILHDHVCAPMPFPKTIINFKRASCIRVLTCPSTVERDCLYDYANLLVFFVATKV